MKAPFASHPRAFKNASLILGLINVLQPVHYEILAQEFREEHEDELLEHLEFLESRRLIRALPEDRYRTTWKGQRWLWSRVLTERRDVQRLWYLSELSDRIRRDEGGEVS